MELFIPIVHYVQPWAVSFLSISSPGGGGGERIPPPPPPPSDLGRGATKNSEIWHVCRVSQYARADDILHYRKAKSSSIMQIYAPLLRLLSRNYNW